MALITRFLIISIATLAASPLFAECPYPDVADIPDGATATNDQMVDGQKTVKAYMAEMDAYLKCLDDEEAALSEEQKTPEEHALRIEKYNAAVDVMEANAAAFNEQVREYKAANP
jgi:hypothetical protein